ncbi:MAG: hypothetical protein ACM33T_12635 [Solirubrobacterales bacterium]
MTSRRVFLQAVLGMLAVGPALASGSKGGGAGKELYLKLQPIAVEFWDSEGMFHQIHAELTVVIAKEGVKYSKGANDRIAKVLSSMPWEEVIKGNPAVTLKTIAYDVLRREPEVGESTVDVLVIKMMVR